MSREADTIDELLRLTVVEARREDVGRGIVRLDPEAMKRISAAPGDVLEVKGRTGTVAKAMPTFKETRGREAIQLDGVTRLNAGVALGQKVEIAKASHHAARRVVMVPLGTGKLHEDDIDYMARHLDGLAVRAGDRVRAAFFGASHRDFQGTAHRTGRRGDDPAEHTARHRQRARRCPGIRGYHHL